MRVIIAHNFYRSDSPSGENAVVEYEVRALRESGVEVIELFRHSDDIVAGRVSKTQLALSPIRNKDAIFELRRMIKATRPDVLHAHNLFPLLSPALITEAQKQGIATVATVHNHRYYCMAATLRRDGHDCDECLDLHTPAPGFVHGCYRDSRLQSASMAMALTRHAPTFKRIDRCIALSTDIRDTLVRFGVRPERISVKPNTVDDPGRPTPPGRDFLFVGRLIEEKGIALLLEAWQRAPDGSRGRLVIAGDGPLREHVEQAGLARDDVSYLGKVEPDRVHELMVDAALVVMPSLWSEAFPRVVVEAMVRGRGVLTTPFGSLPEIIGDGGWVVAPNARAWDIALTSISRQRQAIEVAGSAARARFERRYARSVVMDQLISIYRETQARAG